MKTLIVKLDDITFKKLQKMKDEKFPEGADWEKFFTYLVKNVRLEELSGEKISKATKENLFDLWCQNFSENLPYIREGKTIAELVPPEPEKVPKGAGIVIGAGPSIWKHNHLKLLAEKGKSDLTLVLADRMLIPCLKAGVTPDKFPDFYTIGVDGAEVIAKWYDDPIVGEYGPKIKSCIITSTHPKVVEILRKYNVDTYWFNPIFDDWRDNESYTRLQLMMTKSKKNPKGVPSLSCLGNAGSAAYVLAFALLRRSPICLIGINFGWEEGTPLEETQYFSAFLKAAHGDVQLVTQAYKTIYNPYFKCKTIVDPVFDHYREAFLESLKDVPSYVETFNATEGGCLFGEGIHCIRFEDFLKYYDNLEELKKHVLKGD